MQSVISFCNRPVVNSLFCGGGYQAGMSKGKTSLFLIKNRMLTLAALTVAIAHKVDVFPNENNVYSRAVLHNSTDNVKVQ